MSYICEVETRVMPATLDALRCFSKAELVDYGRNCLGLHVTMRQPKAVVVRDIYLCGKATILAQLLGK